VENPLFDYSALPRRDRLELPDGARVAVWVGINIEHYTFGQPALSLAPFTAELVPDPLNYGWRDYGTRAGVWRLARIFERTGVRPTAILNSDVCELYPEIIEEGVRLGWAWVAHGRNNSTWQVGMEEEDERAYIASVADRIESATGARPRGWLGPALPSTMNTTSLLAELGFTHTLDWANDDQPYDMNVRNGRLISLPYSSEVNDIPLLHIRHFSGEQFRQAIIDQFEVLHEEGAESARVLGIGVHPFLAGQAFRARYLAEALEQMAGRDDVWLTTSEEIADWYANAVPR
jgi:allantoinase